MAFSLEDCRVASTDENVRDSKLTLLQKDFYLICREMPLIRGVQPTKELLNALFMEYLLYNDTINFDEDCSRFKEHLKEVQQFEHDAKRLHLNFKIEEDEKYLNEKVEVKKNGKEVEVIGELSKEERNERVKDIRNDLELLQQKSKECSEKIAFLGMKSVEFSKQFEDKQQATTKLMVAHYRSVCTKQHPDKAGGLSRAVFDRFKVFMDVLRDPEKRIRYISHMEEIVGPRSLSPVEAHKAWIKANSDDDDDVQPIMMTVKVAQPIKPFMMQLLGNHQALVRFTVPLELEQHLPYCMVRYQVRKRKSKPSKSSNWANAVTKSVFVSEIISDVKINLSTYGDYDLRFCVVTDAHISPWSDELKVIHHDVTIVTADAGSTTPSSDVVAAKRILSSRCHSLRVQMTKFSSCLSEQGKAKRGSDSTKSSLARQLDQHEKDSDNMMRAGTRVYASAIKLAQMVGDPHDPRVENAMFLCNQMRVLLQQIEFEMCMVNPKREDRLFVIHLASMLLSGECKDLLEDRNTTVDQLFRSPVQGTTVEGSSVTRMYELIVGKSNSSLEVSSAVCFSAAKRADLFDTDQRKALSARGVVLERQERTEYNYEKDKSAREARIWMEVEADFLSSECRTILSLRNHAEDKAVESTASSNSAPANSPDGVLQKKSKKSKPADSPPPQPASEPEPEPEQELEQEQDPDLEPAPAEDNAHDTSHSSFDWSGHDVILQKLHLDEASFNGRSGNVTWKLGGNQWAVKLGPPALSDRSDKAALTVFDYQMRLMSKAEQIKCKARDAKLFKQIEEQEEQEKAQKLWEQEQRDISQAMKLVEQSERRSQKENEKVKGAVVRDTEKVVDVGPSAVTSTPQPTPAPVAPRQVYFTYGKNFARERIHGMITSFDNGVGFISYRVLQKTKKIFFHLSEVLVPEQLDAIFPNPNFRTNWLFRQVVKTAKVSFQIGSFNRKEVAEKIILTGLKTEELAVVQQLIKPRVPSEDNNIVPPGDSENYNSFAPPKSMYMTPEELLKADPETLTKGQKKVLKKLQDQKIEEEMEARRKEREEREEMRSREPAALPAGNVWGSGINSIKGVAPERTLPRSTTPPPAPLSSDKSHESPTSPLQQSFVVPLPPPQVAPQGVINVDNVLHDYAPTSPSAASQGIPIDNVNHSSVQLSSPHLAPPPFMAPQSVSNIDNIHHSSFPRSLSPMASQSVGNIGGGLDFTAQVASLSILPTPPPGIGGLPPGFINNNDTNDSALLIPSLVGNSDFGNHDVGNKPSTNIFHNAFPSVLGGPSFAAFGNSSGDQGGGRGGMGCSKLRNFASKYLACILRSHCRKLLSSAVYAGDRISYFPFIRQRSSSNVQEDVFRGIVLSRLNIPCSVMRISRAKCKDDVDEMKILKNFTQSNILRLYDVHADVESCFIATEVKHGDLEMLIASNRLRTNESRFRIVQQLLSGICFLHSNGFTHRDIKPQSIAYVHDGEGNFEVKLTGFGISKIEGGDNSSKGFQAQEIVLKNLGELDDQSWSPSFEDYKMADVFSFGVVSFFILTNGGHPFSNPDPKKSRRVGDRENRIADGELPNCEMIEDQEAMHMVQACLFHDSILRPDSEKLLNRHPMFFDSKKRIEVLNKATIANNLDYLDKFCTNWNWHSAFFDILEGGALLDPRGEEVYFRVFGLELVRFLRYLIANHASFPSGSKVDNALSCFDMMQASFISDSEDRICAFIKSRVSLFWCWLYEDDL